MKQSMFFVVALALCALPSVLGYSCYSCTPNMANREMCNTMGSLMMSNCTADNDSCVRVTMMSALLPNTYVYSFGCANGTTCADYNMTACHAAMMMGNITSCNTECCQGMNCITLPMMPTTSDMPTASVTSAPPPEATTPSAGDKLHAYFGLLCIILMTMVWQ